VPEAVVTTLLVLARVGAATLAGPTVKQLHQGRR
jgi:hypothetical protein